MAAKRGHCLNTRLVIRILRFKGEIIAPTSPSFSLRKQQNGNDVRCARERAHSENGEGGGVRKSKHAEATHVDLGIGVEREHCYWLSRLQLLFQAVALSAFA